MIKQGSWVEIYRELLKPGQRAPQVPEDTQAVSLELRARGFLTAEAELGDQVSIRTLTGRRLSGRLVAVDPGYNHSFGPPVAELLSIGGEVRELLRDGPSHPGGDHHGGSA